MVKTFLSCAWNCLELVGVKDMQITNDSCANRSKGDATGLGWRAGLTSGGRASLKDVVAHAHACSWDGEIFMLLP